MRFHLILSILLIAFMQVSAKLAAQEVTIHVRNAPLESVFSSLKEQTGYVVVHNSHELGRAKVTLNLQQATVEQVVLSCLADLPYSYTIRGTHILIRREESAAGSERVKPLPAERARQTDVHGRVTDHRGEPLEGVTVSVKHLSLTTVTDRQGNFVVAAPADASMLVFSMVGFRTEERSIPAGRMIHVALSEYISDLEEVVVVGYGTQAKKDIVGSANVVNVTDLNNTPSSNLVAQLQGRSSGVTVSSTGDPNNTSRVRIRGFSSYGNNDPLYVVDGVPTTNYATINPMDIASVQVLKDAVSASIYGARAANGVIIITTKQGKTGGTDVSFDTYIGVQALPFNRTPQLLNTAELVQYLEKTTAEGFIDPVFGKNGSFSIPEMYVVSKGFKGGVSRDNPLAHPDLYTINDYDDAYQIFETSPGTDWYRALAQTGISQNHQFSANGGTDRSTFSLGLNYFSQEGTFKFTEYNRFSTRVNSSFKIGRHITIGENMQVAATNRNGDNVVTGEGGAWSNAYRMSPFIPVHDIGGGYGGTLIGGTSGVGQNPLAVLERRKDWTNQSLRAFGNVYADVVFFDDLTYHVSLGLDLVNGNIRRANLREYEKSESNKVTRLTESNSRAFNWVFTHTLTYQKTVDAHDFTVLAGIEALKNNGYNLSASKNNFDFENDDFLSLSTGLPETLGDVSATSSRSVSTLASYFARLDYGFKGRYLLSATYRIDGSSLFGADVRYGRFPSAGLAWRISEEDFAQGASDWLDDLKVRVGWGQMGSISNVPVLNQFSSFSSSPNANFYDLNGVNSGSTQGYGVNTIGNERTKWETTETANIGVDLTILQGTWSLALDLYQSDTRDLLVPSMRNGMEIMATRPLINLGTMRNRGIDIGLVHRKTVSTDFSYDVAVNFTRYRNELTKLNDEDSPYFPSTPRLSNFLITDKGYPISSFYGYLVDGFYNDEDQAAQGPTINGGTGRVGSWKFKDINGDGDITVADRTFMGSPHPDFQMGVDVKLRWRDFDFNAFAFWNQGGQLFNYTKFFTYMGPLGGAIASGKLHDAWTPETAGQAKVPKIGAGDESGYTSFITGNPSSFYVEDGSYLRLKTLQLGYSFPEALVNRVKLSNLRIYLQAQNLFTVTRYTGADPDLGLISGDGTDQNIGVDYSGYPNPRIYMVGVNLKF